MSALAKPRITLDEYFALEAREERPWEFIHGEVFKRDGCTLEHHDVAVNLMMKLRGQRRPGLHVYFAQIRVRADGGKMYLYPDFMALLGKPEFETHGEPRLVSLLNPQVIVEILSPSTAPRDRSEKFLGYQQIESVTDYILVSAERMQAEQYTRYESGIWHYQAFRQPTDVLRFASVGCDIPLSEVYDRVSFGTVSQSRRDGRE